MIRKLQIGDVQLENNLILAPMAGVTDLPFRLLCKEQGAGLLCMEMVSAKAILYNNKNTEALMAIDDREPPVSLQLFGSDPDVISEMAKRIEERPFSILDINMGCPVPKVTGNGEGSALMKNPKMVEEIITKTARAIRKPLLSPFQNCNCDPPKRRKITSIISTEKLQFQSVLSPCRLLFSIPEVLYQPQTIREVQSHKLRSTVR